jgi:hypothetical protein
MLPSCLQAGRRNRFTPYPGIPHTAVVKGDGKYLCIAAASLPPENLYAFVGKVKTCASL